MGCFLYSLWIKEKNRLWFFGKILSGKILSIDFFGRSSSKQYKWTVGSYWPLFSHEWNLSLLWNWLSLEVYLIIVYCRLSITFDSSCLFLLLFKNADFLGTNDNCMDAALRWCAVTYWVTIFVIIALQQTKWFFFKMGFFTNLNIHSGRGWDNSPIYNYSV